MWPADAKRLGRPQARTPDRMRIPVDDTKRSKLCCWKLSRRPIPTRY